KEKQAKTLELYQKNKVNPASGCLPMIVQIPIFIALYTAFSDTIDLWKSPFLWIKDLSEPDTVWQTANFYGFGAVSLNVLPLIMVGTQFFQMQMTSTAGSDPNQKTMMYMMPFIMLFFFWSMPSGVTMYWTIQNILSIVQQVYTNKFVETKKNAPKKSAAATVTTTVTNTSSPQYTKGSNQKKRK
ncbi:MAG TPA: YidC/Oxa1 family membrane protein insertase, partial [Leptospiraceae bacterium]|nr:YidC/Oxa1 family membrane protein insertase [Leptospiraceae bacterium]